MATNNYPLLKQRRAITRLKFLFLLKLNVDPYKCLSLSSSWQTRHNHGVTPYFARTNLFKHSFFPRTISEWNTLPTYAFPEHSIPDWKIHASFCLANIIDTMLHNVISWAQMRCVTSLLRTVSSKSCTSFLSLFRILYLFHSIWCVIIFKLLRRIV